MLAEKDEQNDVAIYWPKKAAWRLATIRKSGKCPSFGAPKKLRVPGGLVALVAEDGEVLLVFRIARVDRHVPVTAANGKHYERGCVLIAKRGTVRKPGRRDPKVLSVNTHALGAFAYFNTATCERVFYELGNGGSNGTSGARTPVPFPARRYPLFANNIGKTLSQPERELIRAYTKWIGDITAFAHHSLKETGLYTDLFIPSRWTLFEAKSSIRRTVLREAIGQLFDYQRHYDRSPRLAALLPRRPAQTMSELFERKRITVVWRSRGGSFRDSAGGTLTTELRAWARERALTQQK